MTPLLEVDDVTFSYGALQVLFGVSLHVEARESVALLGTNGAGKSTLLKLVSGLTRPAGGRILFDGEDITSESAERRVARGIVQVAGGRATFPSLTVRENLHMGAYQFRRDRRRVAERMDAALVPFPVLRERFDSPAGLLSGGEQQMLAVARAILTEPRLLLVDELSLGLAPVVLGELLGVIGAMAKAGTTMLLVEQSLNVSLDIAERAYFMEKGDIRFGGTTAELARRDDIVRSVFFGAPTRVAR